MNEEEKLTSQTTEEADTPEEEKASTATPLGGRSVFPYLAILFATAFLLLLFAYLMQQRDSEEIMGNLSDLRASMGNIQSIDQLVEENRQLREEKDGLQSRLDELEKQLDELEGNLAASEDLAAKRFTRLEEAQLVIDAFSSLADLRQLYEDDDLEGAKALLDSVEEDGSDTVETGFYQHFSGHPDWPEAAETYPPLVEWRELKQAVQDALAEEEEAE